MRPLPIDLVECNEGEGEGEGEGEEGELEGEQWKEEEGGGAVL